jgi:hypothetical protein
VIALVVPAAEPFQPHPLNPLFNAAKIAAAGLGPLA